ncbi:predicted protein [Naegleria gruberi]|uniref:Predicted protein n=1 Tax=Naegleria gruberi TaxID=5762 RepID=D2VXD3_NAEGR|nr:uncharacterized protein NAEGRDRAFT_73705 [Naegleria gruberi]EFC38420.1 predicted protein [Naegleria gruberi]|eukprot:XP_002671164.1 predicted protein [Naegleria gruberi strain NEG-M]
MGKPLPNLELLWVNSNNITNLSAFIERVKVVCPNLQYFSMMANKACPNFFVGGTPELYQDYRHFVISRLPKLKVLDQNNVTDEERQQALQHYANLKIQPTTNTVTSNHLNRPSI